ncbi:hypothetical protein [Vallitalea guaymasensis]|uniref:Uncharacterized protein n=1 Tax=Vallitalea guaymasensis TaxID=1185412 RepID=A0A8J8ME34_9FIRM|nr:hypothetical protein [Vallitalea guaymasensis]QUH31144.1 hypothetical protein HYG85_20350 [Vallitalea guaymasensis]
MNFYICQRLNLMTLFHNLSSTNNELVKKLNPTVFDTIMVSTHYMLISGNHISGCGNLEEKRLELLRDEKFKEYTSERTTNIVNILGRFSRGAKILYGIEYE